MEVITVESLAWQKLSSRIEEIANYLVRLENGSEKAENEIWVDSGEVCRYLNLSMRTVQRLRASGDLAFTPLHGQHYYQIGDIKKLLACRKIKSSEEHIQDLIKNHRINVTKRGNTKQNG